MRTFGILKTLFILFFINNFVFSQAPAFLSFQAVVRNQQGQLVSSQSITVRVRILEESAQGNAVFEETHVVTSSFTGLITLVIGSGENQTGAIDSINWDKNIFFIETSFRLPGEAEFLSTMCNQILSVPYALCAKTAENSFGGDYNDLMNQPNFKDSILRYSPRGELQGEIKIETKVPQPSRGNCVITGGKITENSNLTINSMGICWGENSEPTIYNSQTELAHSSDSFSLSICGLTGGLSYFVRAFVTTTGQTFYGRTYEVTLSPPPNSCQSAVYVKDFNNNSYNTVQIGNQCWMRENLRSTHFSDGTAIKTLATPDYNYVYYDFMTEVEKKSYGYLYNCGAIMRGQLSSNSEPSHVQGVCPEHWHVPSLAEWQTMSSYISTHLNGASGVAVALAKDEVSWQTIYISAVQNSIGNPASVGFNSSYFSALPAGIYNQSPGQNGDFTMFSDLGYMGYWATSTLQNFYSINVAILSFNSSALSVYPRNFNFCFSVRCVKD